MARLNDVNLSAINEDSPQKQMESLVRQINEQGRLISNEDRTKIIKDNSGTPRILFGEGSDQFYGMKVSQEGFDVTSADDNELIFNSNQNVFKIVASDTLAISNPTTVKEITTIPHNLGYAPAFLCFFANTQGPLEATTYNQLPFFLFDSVLHTIDGIPFPLFTGYLQAYVDETNLYIEATAQPNTMVGTLKYYLLQETIT